MIQSSDHKCFKRGRKYRSRQERWLNSLELHSRHSLWCHTFPNKLCSGFQTRPDRRETWNDKANISYLKLNWTEKFWHAILSTTDIQDARRRDQLTLPLLYLVYCWLPLTLLHPNWKVDRLCSFSVTLAPAWHHVSSHEAPSSQQHDPPLWQRHSLQRKTIKQPIEAACI